MTAWRRIAGWVGCGVVLAVAVRHPACAQAMQNVTEAPKLPVVITPGTGSGFGHAAVARRGVNGHFWFDAMVNGVRLPMMFDTGASYVALRYEDAPGIGIDMSALVYSGRAQTGNGIAQTAPVTISSLTVGNITLRQVKAMVAKPGKLNFNLLGQSFMTRVAGFNVEGNQLTLRGAE